MITLTLSAESPEASNHTLLMSLEVGELTLVRLDPSMQPPDGSAPIYANLTAFVAGLQLRLASGDFTKAGPFMLDIEPSADVNEPLLTLRIEISQAPTTQLKIVESSGRVTDVALNGNSVSFLSIPRDGGAPKMALLDR